jgi:hypothetical protein
VISEAKKAELDQIALQREPSMKPAPPQVTLQSLHERVTALEMKQKAEEKNG